MYTELYYITKWGRFPSNHTFYLIFLLSLSQFEIWTIFVNRNTTLPRVTIAFLYNQRFNPGLRFNDVNGSKFFDEGKNGTLISHKVYVYFEPHVVRECQSRPRCQEYNAITIVLGKDHGRGPRVLRLAAVFRCSSPRACTKSCARMHCVTFASLVARRGLSRQVIVTILLPTNNVTYFAGYSRRKRKNVQPASLGETFIPRRSLTR